MCIVEFLSPYTFVQEIPYQADLGVSYKGLDIVTGGAVTSFHCILAVPQEYPTDMLLLGKVRLWGYKL